MYKAKTIFANHALNTIKLYVKTKNIDSLKSQKIPNEFKQQLACFVSIHKNDDSLRGCIGTIEAREDNLWLEIISNAISACTRDSRFSPLTEDELEHINVSVDVLSKPKRVIDINELNPKKYGVIVSDGKYLRGVLLPNLEGVDTVKQQISIAKRKAGLADINDKLLEIYSFTSTRYY